MSSCLCVSEERSPRAVCIEHLALADFRSWRGLRVDLDARPVILSGANGSGKTNILEALSFLAPGRGLRRARLHEITTRDKISDDNSHVMLADQQNVGENSAKSWAINATLSTPEGPVRIGTGRAPGPSDRRLVKLNGVPARSQSQLGDFLSVIWLTPSMDRLFTDPASERRRFIDRLVFNVYPQHARHLSLYENALRQRTRLLKEGPLDPSWLSSLEDAMAAHGVAIASARSDTVTRLSQFLRERDNTPFPRARLQIKGWLENYLDDGYSALELEDFYKDVLRKMRQDCPFDATCPGAHGTDLLVEHTETGQAARLCSTGEQKALLISILLSQARMQDAEKGTVPILLFDEVAAHLDQRRRETLYDELVALGCQAWLTGTDRALFESLGPKAQFFSVSGHQLL